MHIDIPIQRFDPRVRLATPQDVPRILELIVELARYEKAEHEAKATSEQLHTSLFGSEPAVFALVAERTPGGDVVGCALWFLNFSTWLGVHGIYLEDLFVSAAERGTGLGKSLLHALAVIADANNFGRVEWSVLKWNTPSIEFYQSIGAQAQVEWDTMRLSADALSAFAASA